LVSELILALESSAKAASVALVEVSESSKILRLGEYFQNCGLTHSQTLLKMTEDLLSNCAKKISDITKIAVAKGPGSFTGIRIGIAAAEGLAWGADIPIVGVSTLEAMACGCPYDGVIIPAMDARRSEVYTAAFKKHEDIIVRLEDDAALSSEKVAAFAGHGTPLYLIGDGAEIVCESLIKQGVSCKIAPENARFQSAYGVALASIGLEGGKTVEPEYLRIPQAERERNAQNG